MFAIYIANHTFTSNRGSVIALLHCVVSLVELHMALSFKYIDSVWMEAKHDAKPLNMKVRLLSIAALTQ